MLLPMLVAYQLFPDLAPQAKATLTKATFLRSAPMIGVLALIQLFGQLAIIAVATDGGRSTVGAALRRAFIALPRVIVAALALVAVGLVLLFALSIVVGVVIAMVASPAAMNDRRIAATLGMLMLLPALWAGMRLCLFPMIAVAEEAGPLVAIRESWRTSRGHVAGIAVLFLFAVIAGACVQGLVSLVVEGSGTAVDAMLGGHFGRFVASVIDGAAGAVVSLYLTMMSITIWRRLREPGHTLHAHV